MNGHHFFHPQTKVGHSLLRGAPVSYVLFTEQEMQENGPAPHCSAWTLRLSPTQACVAPLLEPEAHPHWLYEFTYDFNQEIDAQPNSLPGLAP